MSQKSDTKSEIEITPSDWKNKRIGDCCYLVRNQFLPSKNDIRPYIGLEHIEQQTLMLNNIGSTEDIKSNKFLFKFGQILFGKLRPYFRKLYLPKFDGVCSTDIWVIDTKENNDNSFFFYFLADKRIIDEADYSSEGTKMPRAKWDYLEKLEYPIPPLDEQKAIAKILSDLDSKIEVNQKMNKTLELIGRTLFKHWFIDFEFPDEEGEPYKTNGGEMVFSEEVEKEVPIEWKIGIISDIAKVVGGGTPLTKNKEYYSKEGIPWLTPRDLSNNKNKFIQKGERDISELGLEKSSAKLLPRGTVLFTSRAPIGYIGIALNDISTNQGFKSLIPRENMKTEYLYQLIKNITPYIKNIASGSTFKEISGRGLKNIPIAIPQFNLICKYEKFAEPINEMIIKNQVEIKILKKIRDTLLPKLISGQVRIKSPKMEAKP